MCSLKDTILSAGLLALLLFGTATIAKAGHEQGEGRAYLIQIACDNPASPVGIIQASHRDESGAFLQAQYDQGLCKQFLGKPLWFWFDKVVIDDLVWSDGDLMYVIQGHDRTGFTLFIWTKAENAHRWGWLPTSSPR